MTDTHAEKAMDSLLAQRDELRRHVRRLNRKLRAANERIEELEQQLSRERVKKILTR